jgi:hypothetical protein
VKGRDRPRSAHRRGEADDMEAGNPLFKADSGRERDRERRHHRDRHRDRDRSREGERERPRSSSSSSRPSSSSRSRSEKPHRERREREVDRPRDRAPHHFESGEFDPEQRRGRHKLPPLDDRLEQIVERLPQMTTESESAKLFERYLKEGARQSRSGSGSRSRSRSSDQRPRTAH